MNPLHDFKPEIKLFLIIAAVSVVIAVGGILLLQAGLGPSSPTPQEQPQSIDNQQSTIDTSGWQTYRNDEFGFELKYPHDWNVEMETAKIEIQGSKGSFISIVPTGRLTGSFEAVRVESEVQQFVEYRAEVSSFLTEEEKEWSRLIQFEPPPSEWTENNYIYAGVDWTRLEIRCAVEITAEHPECGAGDGLLYFGEVDEREMQTINQILSTFRFVE